MTRNKGLFTKLDESIKLKVRFIDDNIIVVERRGKILIQLRNGNHAYILDVLYVPAIKNNLLNLGQLLERNYIMRLEKGALHVFNESTRMILKAPLS